MSQEAASEADLRGCKLFNPEAAAPLGARAPFPRIPTARAGKGLQLKVREQDKAGKDQLSSNAGGSHGGHMSEAHNSQLAPPRPPPPPPENELWKPESKGIGDQHQLPGLRRESWTVKDRECEAPQGPAREAGKGKGEIWEEQSIHV